VRRRQCFNGHRFQSIEIYRECYGSTRERCKTYFTVTVARYKTMWERNKDIARSIAAGVSWQALAEKYALSRTAVYLALKAGRNNVPYSSSDKLKEYARPLRKPAVLPVDSSGPRTMWR
jgi:radical SAM superfamily enzyme with C-terminal helix-hairpin-helix motif